MLAVVLYAASEAPEMTIPDCPFEKPCATDVVAVIVLVLPVALPPVLDAEEPLPEKVKAVVEKPPARITTEPLHELLLPLMVTVWPTLNPCAPEVVTVPSLVPPPTKLQVLMDGELVPETSDVMERATILLIELIALDVAPLFSVTVTPPAELDRDETARRSLTEVNCLLTAAVSGLTNWVFRLNLAAVKSVLTVENGDAEREAAVLPHTPSTHRGAQSA